MGTRTLLVPEQLAGPLMSQGTPKEDQVCGDVGGGSAGGEVSFVHVEFEVLFQVAALSSRGGSRPACWRLLAVHGIPSFT